MYDNLLAWITAISGLTMLFVVAGPGSMWPFGERLLVWFAGVSLIGASIFRLVAVYDPSVAWQAAFVGGIVMVVGRICVFFTGVYLVLRWLWKRNPQWRSPVEVVGDLVAGHRR